jgi:hypothetical protein
MPQRTTYTYRQDVHPFMEVMLTHRVDFGQENLDKAFLLYSQVRENSSDPQNLQEIEEKFIQELNKRGVSRYFHEMLKAYCKLRVTTSIQVVNDRKSYNRMVEQITEVKDIKAMIRRVRCQKDRLPLSSLIIGNVEYEIHGDYMEMCLQDMIILLSHAEPDCNPDRDEACIPYNNRNPIVRVYNSDEESDQE